MDDEQRAAYEAEYEPIYAKFKAQTDAEHEEVVGLGGLYVLGTERHESRRIDNQLRGRSGRQGDPGESLFYLSLEDDLMRMFASDRVASIMERLKWPDDEPIEAKMVSRAVENAQKQIEELNYERRKNVLKYDDVMNAQREAIYGQRREILEGRDLKDQAVGFVEEVVEATVDAYCPADVFPEDWDLDQLVVAMTEIYPTTKTAAELAGRPRHRRAPGACVIEEALAAYEAKEVTVTPEVMRELERVVLLNITDTKWREHLYEMDYLQEGIHLRVVRAEGSDHRVPARGLRDVPGAHRVDPRRLRALHLPGRARASGGAAGRAHPRAGQPSRGRERRSRDREREPGRQRQDPAERALPLRQREEVQEVPRRGDLTRA